MKFAIILIACWLVVAYADDTKVLKELNEVNPEDFKYAIELSNSIRANQEGHLQDKENWLVKGDYEYVSKEGKTIKVSYVADDHGYHPKVEQQ